MTPAERMAKIDQQFDISFGVFDGRMRDEQGAIAGQRGGRGGSTGSGKNGTGGAGPTGTGTSESGTGGEGDSGTGGKDGGAQGGTAGSGESGQGQGDGQGRGGRAGGGGGYGGGALGGNGPSTPPADIPDGRDDDVVARQLREAAMAETDPELREKLWQEYRNYKKGS